MFDPVWSLICNIFQILPPILSKSKEIKKFLFPLKSSENLKAFALPKEYLKVFHKNFSWL